MKTKKETANERTLINPTLNGNMEHLKDESLMLFGYCTNNGKKYRLYYGIGRVYRVVKGDKMDMVYINFGLFRGHMTRVVVVHDNQARRQTLTLKRGQMCQVYGLCRYYQTKVKNKKGEEVSGTRLGLYATAIQGWYVPTMLDIRRLPKNEDIVSPSQNEERFMDNMDDLLNEFMTGNGEDNGNY